MQLHYRLVLPIDDGVDSATNFFSVHGTMLASSRAFVKMQPELSVGAGRLTGGPYFSPAYSSICVVRSIGYEIVTSVILPDPSLTAVSFGITKPE